MPPTEDAGPPDWLVEQLRPLRPVTTPDGRSDLAYDTAGEVLRGGGVLGEEPFDVDLLVHDHGVVVQVTTALASRLAGPDDVAAFAEGNGLHPLLEHGATDDRARPDRCWIQAVQSEHAVLVLAAAGGRRALVGLGALPETSRYGARLLGVLRVDLLLGDEPLLPTLTEGGVAAFSARGRAWRGVVLTTEQG